MKDAFNQQDLAHKAKLQVELFSKAQEFAKQVGIEEMKAKQYANQLNEATKKAQYARAMMFQTAAQVRMLADQTIQAIQPMRCIGPKCQVNTSPMMSAVNEFTNAIPDFSSFSFKQNLRGIGTGNIMNIYEK